jgi:catechol 2,3-dioxygenase-like lactoylglutathione lyase family enzyme
MTFSRLLINLCSDRLVESRDFYISLLGCEVSFDSDWYVQLRSPLDPSLEFGIIRRSHELVPAQYQQTPTGLYSTFVVRDVDAVYQKAIAMGLKILQEPKNEFYGQRRFLTVDPNECLVDISTPYTTS